MGVPLGGFQKYKAKTGKFLQGPFSVFGEEEGVVGAYSTFLRVRIIFRNW